MDSHPATKKSLGQHWLHDEASLQAMCQAANIGADDTILEIGPGLGTLTKLLVETAKSVVAVEFDNELASQLNTRVPAENLQIINQDILNFDLTSLPKNYKVVANIPYYLTSALIRTLSESQNQPQICALLVQKEVAERVAAAPGDMSLLSVSAQFYWEVSLGKIVKAELFSPPPKVDSQILILSRPLKPRFKNVDEKIFFQLVKAGFSARRKTLLNSLSGGLRLNKSETTRLLDAAKIQPELRPQELSLGQWHDLYLSYDGH